MDFQISKLIQRCQTVGLTRVDTVGTFNNFSPLSKILCPASFHVDISRQLFNSYQELYLSTVNSYLFKFSFDSYFNGFVSLRVQVLSNCGLKTQRRTFQTLENVNVRKCTFSNGRQTNVRKCGISNERQTNVIKCDIHRKMYF